ncbi:MAG: GNAT family N-acetyltransferase [Deltaproteobacteria bacterium]|nr:GNAT family N-acetyltransferase [Deltaproteobacteria bacterium]
MYWRVPGGKGWRALQGAPAKAALTELIAGGEARGALAFAGDTPVGWVTYGPRLDFRRLERARTLRCDDAERVWSVPCFFIASDYRGQGVARRLLEHAIAAARAAGAAALEAYPVAPAKPGGRLPAADAYTGTVAMFEAAGFTHAPGPPSARHRMRRALTGR